MNKQVQAIPSKSKASSRQRLLEIAVDVFGKHGFEAATTRKIAKEAGVNIAAIPYYFNGKEGLYHAVVNYIVEKIEANTGTTFLEMSALASNKNLSRKKALRALEILLESIINFMVGSPEAPRISRIILREQIDPSPAYDIIFTRIMTPFINYIAAFLAAAFKNIPTREARLRAMAIMGQIMAFRVARETAVRSMGLKGYTQDETREIRNIIIEHTRGIFKFLGDSKTK
jgi:AcrR family transcriptional regulator